MAARAAESAKHPNHVPSTSCLSQATCTCAGLVVQAFRAEFGLNARGSYGLTIADDCAMRSPRRTKMWAFCEQAPRN